MPNYQQYQKFHHQPSEKGYRFGRVFVIVAIILVVYLIGRSIFSDEGEVETVLPNDNSAINAGQETINLNSGANVNISNGNQNLNANLSNANIEAAVSFDLEKCDQLYSRGSSANKYVSLTFNVGTTKEGDIQKLLDVLKNEKIEADFFARGDVAEQNPDLINKISSAGFNIYNLSYNHPHFNDLPSSAIQEQLAKAELAVSSRTEKSTKPFFRPPYGEADEDVVSEVKKSGYCAISWSIDAMDWSSEFSAEQSKARIIDNASNGSIVLMQASNSITAQIVSEVAASLRGSGYQLVGLQKILE